MNTSQQFMIFVFSDCTSLPDLATFDPCTVKQRKHESLVCADGKACGHAGSLRYKLPGRHNEPDDGASVRQRAIQQAVGGFHSRATLHLSVLPLPLRVLALWSNNSLSDSACQFRNAPLPRSIWSENLIFSPSFVSKIRAAHHNANSASFE